MGEKKETLEERTLQDLPEVHGIITRRRPKRGKTGGFLERHRNKNGAAKVVKKRCANACQEIVDGPNKARVERTRRQNLGGSGQKESKQNARARKSVAAHSARKGSIASEKEGTPQGEGKERKTTGIATSCKSWPLSRL